MYSPATRVDHVVIAFSHHAGQRTAARARLRGRGVSGERFYLGVDGCAVVDGSARSVLWDGVAGEMPSFVRMRPREAFLPPCAGDAGE